jgi:putative endonuclease
MHYVYLLESLVSPAKHYVGFTSDLKARLARHDAGQNPSTAFARPWELAGYVAFRTEAKAVAFEKYLKSGSGRTFAKRHLF